MTVNESPRRTCDDANDTTGPANLTTLGVYEIHHIVPELFDGFTGSDASGYVATPEKALFDTVYMRAPAGGPLHLPEIELPPAFEQTKLQAWLEQIINLSVSRQRSST